YAGALDRRVSGAPDSGELPAGAGREEIAVAPAHAARRRRAGAASRHVLVDHELAVVLANGVVGGTEAGGRTVAARGPGPDADVEILVAQRHARMATAGLGELATRHRRRCRVFPIELGRQARTGEAREGIGFVVRDMADRRIEV